MKFKAILFTLLLGAFATSSVFAAIRYVDAAIGVDGDDCLGAGAGPGAGTACLTIAFALGVADPGDTIMVATGVYAEGEIDITKIFITLEGPETGADPVGRVSYVLSTTTCHVDEACIVAPSGKDYIFGISADNVSIDGFDLVGDPATTWAGVKILTGGHDKWTIEYNFIEQVGGKNTGSAFNFSYGIYGDSQTSSGSDTMTGNEINKNWLIELGGTSLMGSNETAGMGIFLEGIEGDGTACLTPADKFDCGVWIHDNTIEDLSVGQNSANFSFDVNGKEPATGITVVQDPQNSSPNNGAYIIDNDFDEDDVFAVTTDNMDFGIVISIGDSIVDQDNSRFTSTKIDVFVVNIDRKASIDEPALADFYKSLNPNLLGPGSDAYFPSDVLAVANSADDATIVFLDKTGSQFRVEVIPQGSSASYKVSLDSDGDVNVRQGARLLFKGELSDGTGGDGVTDIILGGTSGNDLLTVDFQGGNPIPLGDGSGLEDGIDFDGAGGFDKIVIRGSAQSDYETIEMDDADGGTISFESTAVGGSLARTGFTNGTTSRILFDRLEPIDDVVIVNIAFALIAPG